MQICNGCGVCRQLSRICRLHNHYIVEWSIFFYSTYIKLNDRCSSSTSTTVLFQRRRTPFTKWSSIYKMMQVAQGLNSLTDHVQRQDPRDTSTQRYPWDWYVTGHILLGGLGGFAHFYPFPSGLPLSVFTPWVSFVLRWSTSHWNRMEHKRRTRVRSCI